jgi:hypothetical protein
VGFHFRKVDDEIGIQDRSSNQIPMAPAAMTAGGILGVIVRNPKSGGSVAHFLQKTVVIQHHLSVSRRITTRGIGQFQKASPQPPPLTPKIQKLDSWAIFHPEPIQPDLCRQKLEITALQGDIPHTDPFGVRVFLKTFVQHGLNDLSAGYKCFNGKVSGFRLLNPVGLQKNPLKGAIGEAGPDKIMDR